MDLNLEFIRRAEIVTSFNLTSSDFTTLDYKKEIQYLFNKHFFPKFNISKTVNGVNKDKLNRLILELKSISPVMFAKLHSYNLKGIGPGEATLFFLINNAQLGGGTSAGVDLMVGGQGYEMKAVKVSNDNMASDFKLGGTVPLSDIIMDLVMLSTKYKFGGSKTEISGSIVNNMRVKAAAEFKVIESNYADIAYNSYFKGHKIIFVNNSSGPKLGLIESIKQVEKKDIMIERLTSGTVKPKVKL